MTHRLHPLHSRLSPLVWHARRATRKYYEACLVDHTFADSFRRHYAPLAPGMRVLDYGCGAGRLTALALQLRADVTAADVRPDPFWERLRDRARCLVIEPDSVPFAPASFDAVLHFGVLMYVADPKGHLADLARVMVPGGLLSMQVTNRDNYRARRTTFNAGFRQMFTAAEIAALIEGAGFRVETVRMENFYAPVFPLAVNYIRQYLVQWWYDPCDRDSWCVRLTPPARRGVIQVIARRH